MTIPLRRFCVAITRLLWLVDYQGGVSLGRQVFSFFTLESLFLARETFLSRNSKTAGKFLMNSNCKTKMISLNRKIIAQATLL